ncbi:DUF4118 domain-containing protein [Nonomuraea sp. NPDC050691]|uniref:DUF4118 domain-containing protein n=1 Tax=Nonomuraea sp. NPDC050691 TaxID=3155661 RepID=UPI0033E660E3
MTALGLTAITAVLHALRDTLGLPSQILLFQMWMIAVTPAGGLWPALAAAVGGVLLLNYFFTPPYRSPLVSEPGALLALVVFVVVAAAVSAIVELSRGLAEAMGGTLVPEEAPGGGLTMVLTLPASPVTQLPPLPPDAT